MALPTIPQDRYLGSDGPGPHRGHPQFGFLWEYRSAKMRDLFQPEDGPVVLLVWGGTVELTAIIVSMMFMN